MFNVNDTTPNNTNFANFQPLPKMIVMPSNCVGFNAGYLFGQYPGRLAHLHNVDRMSEPIRGIPWALDNGVFGAFSGGKQWSEEPLYRFLDAYSLWNPSWVVVPDSIGNRDETLRMWDAHAPALQAFGVPLAMAVQDGMTPADVPKEATIVFVGGSTSWKWRNLKMWTAAFPRVHVGRVNSLRLLLMAEKSGAESCDGTGWFRSPDRLAELTSYLANNHHHPELTL
jgi:hypothetical protein